MFHYKKELAFVDLASEVFEYPKHYKDNILFMIREYGIDFSSCAWEKIVAKVANTKRTNVAHMDFRDKSEAKSLAALYYFNHSKGSGSVRGNINNISKKVGYIRVACYNCHKDSIDFFLLPPNHECKVNYYESVRNGKLAFNYNRQRDTYSNGLELYRVKDYKEACKEICYLDPIPSQENENATDNNLLKFLAA